MRRRPDRMGEDRGGGELNRTARKGDQGTRAGGDEGQFGGLARREVQDLSAVGRQAQGDAVSEADRGALPRRLEVDAVVDGLEEHPAVAGVDVDGHDRGRLADVDFAAAREPGPRRSLQSDGDRGEPLVRST